MRKMSLYYAEYGQAFFESNTLITVVHENDGDYRREYFDPIMIHFGVQVERVKELNSAQKEALKDQGVGE